MAISATKDGWAVSSVRMSDVADVAGVSVATVSRVLGESGVVSPRLRTRVEAAARQLGYRPNPIAGTLAGARAPLIGVIVPSMTHAFFSGTLDNLSTRLGEAGYQVMADHHEYDIKREQRIVEAFLGWRPSAIVTTGVHHTAITRRLLETAACPVVEMWDISTRRIGTVIGFSNRTAGALAGDHLVKSGRRKIVYAGAIMNRDPRSRLRLQGLTRKLREHDLEPIDVVKCGSRTFRSGAEVIDHVSHCSKSADAIAFSSDVLALGAIFEAQRRGVRVPDDIAIIGYGDFGFSAVSNPSLTSVRPPRDEIGESVAEHLIDRLSGAGAGEIVRDLGVTLTIRESA